MRLGIYLPLGGEANDKIANVELSQESDETSVYDSQEFFNTETPKRIGQILFIDDEPFIRTLASTMLESLGYNVILCAKSSEAVEYYKNNWGDKPCANEF